MGKKKRLQPRPKKKKVVFVSKQDKLNLMKKDLTLKIKYVLEHRKEINERISNQIDIVIGIFEKYDKILLLGGLGLKLINNTPNMESAFFDVLQDISTHYDVDAEVIMEYALSFATAINVNTKVIPDQSDIDKLYSLLKDLKHAYSFIEICENNPDLGDDSLIRMLDRINYMDVRGEGYMQHIEEVYGELFSLHDAFFLQKFGYDSKRILDFLKNLDRKVYSKFGTVLGASLAHERWCEWNKNHPDLTDVIASMEGNESVPFIVGFLRENPDLAGDGEDLNHLTTYQVDDYLSSYSIFWIVPHGEIEEKILDSLSLEFGGNNCFLVDNAFKGHIANVTKVSEKPFVKYEGRYFCFSPILPYRNLFKIVENLVKSDNKHYKNHFLGNEYPECRDNYMERKAKELLEFILPKATFYSSAKYKVIDDDGNQKEAELDVLGIASDSVFVIEAKAHKLSDSDKRAGGKGLKDKLKDSIGYASYQCFRAKKYIEDNEKPTFSCCGQSVLVDKSQIKHIYKIATTFEHFSAIICDMKNLIKEGIMQDDYKDTWIVSVFDLMVVAEFCQNGNDFTDYLNLRKKAIDADVLFCDELDLFAAFCQGKLEDIVSQSYMPVFGLSKMFDDEYNSEMLGLNSLLNNLET